ncbi:MAG: alanine racemase [Clostridia bacterium]|nr:alanine racemase [Clostridia bacterium]
MQNPNCFATRAVAEIDTAALTENFRILRAHVRGARVIAVVKANAYGHGISLTVPALLAAGCDFFAVTALEEALEVRLLAPRADILILGYTPPQYADILAQLHLTQTVFSGEYAAALAAARHGVCVHAKLDGGMCRLGFSPNDRAALSALSHAAQLRLTGAFTHFPAADTDPAATAAALSRFCAAVAPLRSPALLCHAAASAAALTLPEARLDAVRVGLALYGIPPVPTALPLRSVLSLRAPIWQIRDVPRGTPVGYGGAFIPARDTRIGVLPVGYADGFSRRMTGLFVTVRHGTQCHRAPIVGRVCMDHTLLDLTGTPAAAGDTVTLFDDARVPAAHANTIPYEILSALTARVARCTLPYPQQERKK